MTRSEFIETLNDYLELSGMTGDGCLAGDDAKNNTSIYVDNENNVWLTGRESIIRIKTSINVDNVIEFRYDQFGPNGGGCGVRFFIICKDYSGLDFCEGSINFFENGYVGDFRDALEWFEKNPVT